MPARSDKTAGKGKLKGKGKGKERKRERKRKEIKYQRERSLFSFSVSAGRPNDNIEAWTRPTEENFVVQLPKVGKESDQQENFVVQPSLWSNNLQKFIFLEN